LGSGSEPWIVVPFFAAQPGSPVPKRNYGFEKRQKELAKIKKREEKLQRRADRAARPLPESDEPAAPAEPTEE